VRTKYTRTVYFNSFTVLGRTVLQTINMYSPIVKEQLFSWLDCSFSKDTDAVVPIDHHHLCVTIGVDRMVGKPNLIPLTCSIYYEV